MYVLLPVGMMLLIQSWVVTCLDHLFLQSGLVLHNHHNDLPLCNDITVYYIISLNLPLSVCVAACGYDAVDPVMGCDMLRSPSCNQV